MSANPQVVGFKWELQLAAGKGASSSFQVVGQANDVALKDDVDPVETTVRADNGYKNFAPGQGSWNCSVKHLWVPTDAAYILIRAAFKNKTYLTAKFGDQPSVTGAFPTGTALQTGNCMVTKMDTPQAINGGVLLDVELKGCGVLTDSVAP